MDQPLIGRTILFTFALLAAALLSCGPSNHQNGSGACKNGCGNGTCEEIVCMAVGCPCAETAQTCPQDCSGNQTH
jgi:hypothetical protein